jgi:GDPmannose 4,6-dehydratase
MKTAIITGARGQDASYLAELLLDKDYKVVALERRVSSPDYSNIQTVIDNTNYILEQGDITDFGSLTRLIAKYKPDEFYNLAAQSFVGDSWNQSVATCEINYIGTCNCLEAIRLISPSTKFFQASTSEVYGDVITSMQDEETPARPRSPYASSKYASESLVKVFRESYGIFACFARSFNHESPRRGKQFVTRKITSAIAEMVAASSRNYFGTSYQGILESALRDGVIHPLRLGNLSAARDWSHAKDIVRGMWLIMQQDKPDDYVLASGTARTIREFLDAVFAVLGTIDDWSKFVVIDPKFFRPAEVELLCGNATKARTKLEWFPEISFEELVREMLDHDLRECHTKLWSKGVFAT